MATTTYTSPLRADDATAIERVLGYPLVDEGLVGEAGTYHASLVSHLAVYATLVVAAEAEARHRTLDPSPVKQAERREWQAKAERARAQFDAIWSVLGDVAGA